jgi:predicted P-loop ATPase
MSKISLFESFPKKGQEHIPTEAIELNDFLNAIKYGKWQDKVDPIRLEKDKTKRSNLKRYLPGVTIGGTFSPSRKQENLVEHSGFICVDIDNYNDTEELKNDPYTYSIFRSVSGNGLAVVVKINPDKHKESYRWLSSYYFANYGISVDEAPKNVASFRYVSFDPDLFINQKSRKSKTKSLRQKKTKSAPIVLSGDQVDELISDVVNSGKSLINDYDTYLKIAFSIADGFGENGREYFHALCMPSEKYNSQQCDKQYNRCLKGKKSGITVGTFYWFLKENGFELPKGNQRAVQIAAMGKKTGRTKEGVVMQLSQVNNIPKEQAEQIASEVFDRSDIDLSKVSNDPDQLINSLIEWINQNYDIKINSITRMIENKGSELKEKQINTIYLKARIAFNTKDVTKQLIESIILSENTIEYNPITEYIDKNRYRNSTGNVENLIKSVKTETPHYDIFIKKWLLSIIAAYDGNPVRSVLALVGGQNTGKTEWFRRILPTKLHRYYAESKLDAGKDDEMLMTQKLIVMDDEMGGKSKQDEKRFKELTSKSVFSLRAPYARYNEDFKRLALLCGTSNDPNIINDPTGNTRILPVNVESIDHELYNSINKDELFMELLRLYESGEEWQLSKEDMVHLTNASVDFETIHFERELISQFFKPASSGGGYAEKLTSSQIKDYIESNSRQKIMNLRRFGLELSNVFGKATSKRIDGQVKKVYNVIKTGNTSQTTENENLPF